MFSKKYRSSGKDNSIILFGILFSPVVLGMLAMTIFHVVPMVLGILLLIEMAIVSILNATIHDDMHLFTSFWGRFWFFGELVYKHHIHHQNVSRNLGIFYFGWDKVFGSYQHDKELPK
jgi:sterol desaturase/sphingolipid hydroxylase (fatty acid hydroxylase superfamily)